MSLIEELRESLGSAYSVERELGGGGMSHVFVGEEAAFGRKVAIKVLAPELAAGVSAERFQREIKLAGQLQHPNIVPVITAGVAAGLPYYTMPFVDGLSLRQRLDRHAGLPIAEAISILKDVARALAYAHDRGIVHRDIKPENVLLADEAAVVTDFGIAKAIQTARTAAPGGTLTATGTSIGTPAYMAPEQISADPSIDHRADVYSFGCVAYELFSGAAPFAHRNAQQIYAAHLTETPASLIDRRADCPPLIASLVMRCLVKDPGGRPESARSVLRALESGTDAARDSLRAGRKYVLGAIAGAAILAGVAALAGRRSDSSSIHALAVLPFENVGGDTANAYFAEGMSDEITTELARVPGLTLASRNTVAKYRGVDPREIGKALDVHGVIDGTVRRAGDRIRLTAQLTDASNGKVIWTDSYERKIEDVFAMQDSITAAIVGTLKLKLAEPTHLASKPGGTTNTQGTTNLEAYDLYLRGRYLWSRRGEGSIRQAIQHFERAIALDPGFARAHAGIAMAVSILPMYAQSSRSDSVVPIGLRAGRKAIEIDPDLADAHLGLANNLMYELRFDEAERHFKKALELDPDNATAHQWYGDFLYINGRVPDAIRELQTAARLEPFTAVIHNDLGATLSLAERHAEAARNVSRAIEIDSSFVFARYNLAWSLAQLGQLDSALALVTRRGGSDVLGVLNRIHILRRKGMARESKALADSAYRVYSRNAQQSPMIMAHLHAAMLNADSTLFWLNKSIDARDGNVFSISVSCFPAFKFLESDPRWDSTLARMKVRRCQR